MAIFEDLPATFQKGLLSFESQINPGIHEVGIQLSEDGRIWICVDGKAFLRFKPLNHQVKNQGKSEVKK